MGGLTESQVENQSGLKEEIEASKEVKKPVFEVIEETTDFESMIKKQEVK